MDILLLDFIFGMLMLTMMSTSGVKYSAHCISSLGLDRWVKQVSLTIEKKSIIICNTQLYMLIWHIYAVALLLIIMPYRSTIRTKIRGGLQLTSLGTPETINVENSKLYTKISSSWVQLGFLLPPRLRFY